MQTDSDRRRLYWELVDPAPTLEDLHQFFNEALDRPQVTLSKIAFAHAAA